jgi:asparagine synthetase B (glutamine-hydrolysing)
MLDDKAIRSPEEIMRRFSNAPLSLSRVKREMLLASIVEKLSREVKRAGYHWQDKTSQYIATTYLIIKFWLPRLLLNADIYPMHFGLEARVPFAGIHLLKLASKISPALAMKSHIEKYCLKQIAKNKIPESIRNRLKSSLPKNQAIGRRYQNKLKQVLQDPWAKDLISNYLAWPTIQQLSIKDAELSEKERSLLFKIISFSYWYQYHFKR